MNEINNQRIFKKMGRVARTIVILGFWSITQAVASEPAVMVRAAVYFSPDGGAQDAVLSALGNANSEILVQAYSFTGQQIATALVSAKNRGVNVAVILDKSQLTQKHSLASFLIEHGVPTYIDSSHAIAHNKVIIIDRKAVITGSYNFTKAAEHSNAENLLLLTSSDLSANYLLNWNKHLAHSFAYVSKTQSF